MPTEAGVTPRTRPGVSLALASLLAVGFVVRLHGITRPPMDFHPTRQYHGALVARDLYYRTHADVPAVFRQNATTLVHGEDRLEPPVMESLAAVGYHLAGGERLWIPRTAAVLAWLWAAGALAAIARRFWGATGALTAVAVHLALPYGIVASRSFQPDPLMIALVLTTVWALLAHHDRPAPRRVITAAALAGAAFFVKPMALFFIVGAAVGLATTGAPAWRQRPRGVTVLAVAACFLPAVLYYGDGVLGSGFLHHPAEGRFVPWMFATGAFWAAWWMRVAMVVTPVGALVGIVGGITAAQGDGRRLITGLVGGYVALGLVFSYHIHTHDYYSLPLVPMVAMGTAAGVTAVVQRFTSPRARTGLLAAWALAVSLAGAAGVRAAWHRIDAAPGPWMPLRDQALGARLGYSTRVILQDQNYGLPLDYNAHLAAMYWPTALDRLESANEHGVDARFASMNTPVPQDFFIVADLRERTAQPDLWAFLTGRYPVLETGRGYVVFDLRGHAR